MSWLTIAGVYLGGFVSGVVALIGFLIWLGWSMFPPERTEG